MRPSSFMEDERREGEAADLMFSPRYTVSRQAHSGKWPNTIAKDLTVGVKRGFS